MVLAKISSIRLFTRIFEDLEKILNKILTKTLKDLCKLKILERFSLGKWLFLERNPQTWALDYSNKYIPLYQLFYA